MIDCCVVGAKNIKIMFYSSYAWPEQNQDLWLFLIINFFLQYYFCPYIHFNLIRMIGLFIRKYRMCMCLFIHLFLLLPFVQLFCQHGSFGWVICHNELVGKYHLSVSQRKGGLWGNIYFRIIFLCDLWILIIGSSVIIINKKVYICK